MLDFVGNRKYFIGASLLLSVLSVIALFYPGLQLGVDYTSGSSITLQFKGADPGPAAVRQTFVDSGHDEAIVQRTSSEQYFVETNELGETGIEKVNAALKAKFGQDYTVLQIDTVGASVAEETRNTAITAVAVGSIFVMLYIMYVFRSVPHSYQYAVSAIIPLMHDALITLGAFAVLGKLIGAQVNAIFVVGILTIIGFSVHNTVVVFDRIRENARLSPSRPFKATVNQALNETLIRNLNTNFTTLIAVLAMLLIGGQTLRDFLILLFIGIAVGAFSSTFIAAQLLVALQSGEFRRLFRVPFRRPKAPGQPQQA